MKVSLLKMNFMQGIQSHIAGERRIEKRIPIITDKNRMLKVLLVM